MNLTNKSLEELKDIIVFAGLEIRSRKIEPQIMVYEFMVIDCSITTFKNYSDAMYALTIEKEEDNNFEFILKTKFVSESYYNSKEDSWCEIIM